MRSRILLIEDDPGAGTALQKVIKAEGYEVDWVTRGEDALRRVAEQGYQLVVTDLKLPGLSGLELVRRFHASHPKLPLILMTAHGTTETAIEAMKFGAFEYLTKPFEVEELLSVVAEGVASSLKMSEPVPLGAQGSEVRGLVGRSRPMQVLYKEIGRAAATSATVLIRGATGTGKELVARAVYQHSDRSDRPFVAINCAAIPQSLLESELFGHERGAFTSAAVQRIGRFEQAQGGTLFLDEIGDLPLDTQVKLLRVLQEKAFHRVGGDRLLTADVRVIAATHRDLDAAIQQKDFREDLFYRLSVVTIRVPTLSERAEDIPELVKHFIQKYAPELDIASPSIQSEALEALSRHPWPGNVRELENVVRRSLLLARPLAVSAAHVRQALTTSSQTGAPAALPHAAYVQQLLDRAVNGELVDVYWRMVRELEIELFTQAMQRADGNQTKAARWLGITRLKLRERLAEWERS
ncbi:MAG: sigma-54-dependent Fis family transcriptional regulator [Verrucomicrobiales bacterium]|nr:sigma-54-dependent Fis family transcriptional regulator [Verrucomicrobiales bacterium]